MARLLSVNTGRPRILGKNRGRTIVSSIHKQPANGPVIVRRLNLDGDEQADLSVHGGVNKAVYAYPSEHYHYWRERFPGMEMPWGTFGENFTTEGLVEDEVRVGDQIIIGTSRFEVTQPRLPCYKLGMRFGTQTLLRRFLESERSGFYLKVLEEGKVQAGDSIQRMMTHRGSETIASIVRRAKKGE